MQDACLASMRTKESPKLWRGKSQCSVVIFVMMVCEYYRYSYCAVQVHVRIIASEGTGVAWYGERDLCMSLQRLATDLAF